MQSSSNSTNEKKIDTIRAQRELTLVFEIENISIESI